MIGPRKLRYPPLHLAALLTLMLTAGSNGSETATSAHTSGTTAALTTVASLPTLGNAGFEVFEIGGVQYAAVANFWDGEARDMSALSVLYNITALNKNQLELRQVQSMMTKGGHGWDYFEVAESKLLVMPNYYWCGSPGMGNTHCDSTAVYSWHKKKGKRGRFRKLQDLVTNGPAQTDHFTLPSGRTFIVVGENFASEVCVYERVRRGGGRGEDARFERVQCLSTPGGGATAIAEVGPAEVYLVAASYHDPRTGWATRTRVFKLHATEHATPGKLVFDPIPHQEIATNGCHDADFMTINGRHYLFLSEDKSPTSTRITSQIMVFDATTSRFEVLQRIPTDGAHGGELFEGPDRLPWLAVANFGDRQGKRYASSSSVWRYNSGQGLFTKAAEVPTHGATDWEHFVMEGEHYLAVSNEGDLQNRLFQTSRVYRLSLDDEDTSLRDEL